MTQLEWKSDYDADAPAYESAQVIQDRYSNGFVAVDPHHGPYC
jgi:hypothetical protein